MAAKWFPFVATLFLFIWFSNMIGYIPLPVNTAEKVEHLRPRVALLLALRRHGEPLGAARAHAVVWFTYQVEGIRAKGFFGYFRAGSRRARRGAAVRSS